MNKDGAKGHSESSYGSEKAGGGTGTCQGFNFVNQAQPGPKKFTKLEWQFLYINSDNTKKSTWGTKRGQDFSPAGAPANFWMAPDRPDGAVCQIALWAHYADGSQNNIFTPSTWDQTLGEYNMQISGFWSVNCDLTGILTGTNPVTVAYPQT